MVGVCLAGTLCGGGEIYSEYARTLVDFITFYHACYYLLILFCYFLLGSGRFKKVQKGLAKFRQVQEGSGRFRGRLEEVEKVEVGESRERQETRKSRENGKKRLKNSS